MPGKEPYRIGILQSLTGTMAVSERPLVDAALLFFHFLAALVTEILSTANAISGVEFAFILPFIISGDCT